MEYYFGETWAKSRNINKVSMFYPWVPLQEHTHTLKHTHMHITAKATFVCVHAWVLTSCCALDAVWMILDPISHSPPTHIHCPATLASIPLVCHCVPMATYIYPTSLQKSAELSLVAAVGFGCTHKGSVTEKEKQKWAGAESKEEAEWKTFCFRSSEYWWHMSPAKHLFAVARHTAC